MMKMTQMDVEEGFEPDEADSEDFVAEITVSPAIAAFLAPYEEASGVSIAECRGQYEPDRRDPILGALGHIAGEVEGRRDMPEDPSERIEWEFTMGQEVLARRLTPLLWIIMRIMLQNYDDPAVIKAAYAERLYTQLQLEDEDGALNNAALENKPLEAIKAVNPEYL